MTRVEEKTGNEKLLQVLIRSPFYEFLEHKQVTVEMESPPRQGTVVTLIFSGGERGKGIASEVNNSPNQPHYVIFQSIDDSTKI